MARREAAFREEAANQRWYRVFTPSVRKDRGLYFISVRIKNLSESKICPNYKMEKGETTMQIYEELKARGLIAQVTDEEQIRELVNNGKATF